MRYYGIEEKFVNVCEGLYSGVETKVVINRVKSKRFGVEKDLRQEGLVLRGVLGKDALCLHFCLTFI